MLRLRIPKAWADQHLIGGTNPRYIFHIDGYDLVGDECESDDSEFIYLLFQKHDVFYCTSCNNEIKPYEICPFCARMKPYLSTKSPGEAA